MKNFDTVEKAKAEFEKIEDVVDLSTWAENLYESGLLDESEQIDGISPWDIPNCADVVWDNAENVLIRFKNGDFCLWDNSRREWDYNIDDDNNPLFAELSGKIMNGIVDVNNVDSNEDFRKNGWVNIDVMLDDESIIHTGFWYKTPFRDNENYVAADGTPRQSTGAGYEGADDLDLCMYDYNDYHATVSENALYDEELLKKAWELAEETPGHEDAYDAIIEKIKDDLIEKLQGVEDWYELADFLPGD